MARLGRRQPNRPTVWRGARATPITELETFESGVNGNPVGTTFDLLDGGANGTGTWTFDNSWAIEGTLSAKLDITTSSTFNRFMNFLDGATSLVWTMAAFKVSAIPTAAFTPLMTGRVAAVSQCQWGLLPTGVLRIRDGATGVGDSTTVLSPGTVYQLGWQIDDVNNLQTARLYNAAGTLLETIGPGAFTQSPPDNMNFGAILAPGIAVTIWWDRVGYSTIDWIAPVTSVPAVYPRPRTSRLWPALRGKSRFARPPSPPPAAAAPTWLPQSHRQRGPIPVQRQRRANSPLPLAAPPATRPPTRWALFRPTRPRFAPPTPPQPPPPPIRAPQSTPPQSWLWPRPRIRPPTPPLPLAPLPPQSRARRSPFIRTVQRRLTLPLTPPAQAAPPARAPQAFLPRRWPLVLPRRRAAVPPQPLGWTPPPRPGRRLPGWRPSLLRSVTPPAPPPTFTGTWRPNRGPLRLWAFPVRARRAVAPPPPPTAPLAPWVPQSQARRFAALLPRSRRAAPPVQLAPTIPQPARRVRPPALPPARKRAVPPKPLASPPTITPRRARVWPWPRRPRPAVPQAPGAAALPTHGEIMGGVRAAADVLAGWRLSPETLGGQRSAADTLGRQAAAADLLAGARQASDLTGTARGAAEALGGVRAVARALGGRLFRGAPTGAAKAAPDVTGTTRPAPDMSGAGKPEPDIEGSGQ